MRQMSLAKYTSTASSVPSWITAVKLAPASSPQNSWETMRRWPEEDTGRNSVRPWTMDRTITWTQDIVVAGSVMAKDTTPPT